MYNRRTAPPEVPADASGSVTAHWSFMSEDEQAEHLKKYRYAYVEAINKLIKFDKQRIFRFPVDTAIVTDYTTYITNPMDFETMLNKNEKNFYKDDIKKFDEDMALIINNCRTYNAHDSIFYEAAVKLESFYFKLRPLLLKRVNTIGNLINRKFHSVHRSRQRLAASLAAQKAAAHHDPQQHPQDPRFFQPRFEPFLVSHPSNESLTSAPPKTESSEYTPIYEVKRRRRRSDVQRPRAPSLPKPEAPIPMNHTIQIALSVAGLTNETFGKLMANFNGLPRLLNALEVVHHQISINQQWDYWGTQSVARLRRIIENFEWKRSFDLPLTPGKNGLYRKIQILLSHYNRDSYKASVERFIGRENLDRLNDAFPSLSETLKDLCVPLPMLTNSTELKY